MTLMARRFTVLAAVAVIGAVFFSCEDDPAQPATPPPTGPVALLKAIALPTTMNPILAGTKSWVDSTTKRYYLTDPSNSSVDVFDARTHTYVGSVRGFSGPGTNATQGPSSIVFTNDGKAWVSDGDAKVRVVDLTTLAITATVSTAIPACDNGTTIHNCNRANEISYDPEHKIIFVHTPQALDLAGNPIDTYGTFISAVAPYPILGTISFPDRRNQEAPVWDPVQHRFLNAVAGRLVGTTYYDQYVAVIDPTVRPFVVEKKFTIDCMALGLSTTQGALFGINDPAIAANSTIVIPGCGKALIMDTRTGVTKVVQQIGGGNETWYNSGDGRFYVVGADATTLINSLGVIDASTGTWLQSVPAVQATNPTAFKDTNEMFAVGQVTAAQAAAPATDVSACAIFNVRGRGCVLVFAHVLNTTPRINSMPARFPLNGGVVPDDDE